MRGEFVRAVIFILVATIGSMAEASANPRDGLYACTLSDARLFDRYQKPWSKYSDWLGPSQITFRKGLCSELVPSGTVQSACGPTPALATALIVRHNTDTQFAVPKGLYATRTGGMANFVHWQQKAVAQIESDSRVRVVSFYSLGEAVYDCQFVPAD